MRKRWLGLALWLTTTIGVIAGWNWHFQPRPQALETTYRQPLTAETSQAALISAPEVNSQRLLADLEALAYKRHAEVDRRRARDYIAQALEAAGWEPQLQSYADGTNVYAERSGTDPNAGTILLGAHYDTVALSPGADDNATSVATLLEVARLFADQPTARSLQLAFFDQEEVGLVGSRAFADQVDAATLRGAVVLDMVGYACHTSGCQSYPPILPIDPPTDQGDFLAVIGDQGHLPLLNRFAAAGRSNLPQMLTLPVPLLGGITPDLFRSDHAPFWQKGIGALLVTDTANFRNPHYHQASDTLETIDQPFFFGAAQLVVNGVTALLSGPDPLTTARPASAPAAL